MHKLFLLFILFHSAIASAQTRYNLVGDFYPDHIPDEVLFYFQEFEDPLRSYNVIFIPHLKDFLALDSSDFELSSLMICYEKGKVDTTFVNKTNNLSYTIKKDSIAILRPGMLFRHKNAKDEDEEVYNKSLTFCENGRAKYYMHLEEIAKNRMKYTLYYLPSCDLENRSEEHVIRFGEIRLKKKV